MYEITSDGKCYSFHSGKKKLISLTLRSKGYLGFTWYSNGIRKSALIHRLVAQKYIPNPDNKPEVNHKDGNKKNNDVSNLEWCTSLENNRHAVETGLRNNKGENHVNSKLTNEIVSEIRNKYIPRIYSTHKLAKEYGISQRLVLNIVTNKCW